MQCPTNLHIIWSIQHLIGVEIVLFRQMQRVECRTDDDDINVFWFHLSTIWNVSDLDTFFKRTFPYGIHF